MNRGRYAWLSLYFAVSEKEIEQRMKNNPKVLVDSDEYLFSAYLKH